MRNNYRKGDWKADCDVCGFTFYASQLRKTWDDRRVCRWDWEPRHPQERVRAVKDDPSVPWTRERPAYVFHSDTLKFTAGDSTPSVADGRVFETSGNTTITNFDDGTTGMRIRIIATDNITIQNNANILLNDGDFDMIFGDYLELEYSGKWVEVSRT